ncbi:N-6 DNA methylase [Natronosporangium hydrolyticum]|uniref:N-6 DNA methylase n=1 Tax=Natronosporangium hydrolyticum TaxID=2811111 RepID=A0A895YAI5_9ACTN|nr:N-6 DNA methylase [Natronosporangium hydrolyticum]QSB13262.1 N-6 DNA methylase [Natronosporangium hydrolyticum]
MGESEVTPVEIARLAGVGRAAVSNWRRRFDDFPKPVSGTATSPRFALTEVAAWLRRQGKISELSAAERVWQELRAASSDHDLPAALLRAGRVLAIGAPGQFAAALPASAAEPLPPSVAEPLAELAAEAGSAAALDQLLRRLHEATRLPRVPPEVAGLMTGLLATEEPTSLYDPACGTGGLLAAALSRLPSLRLHGDDCDPTLVGLAALRLASHGATDADLRPANLQQPRQAPLEAAAAVGAPVYADREWAADDLAYDPRWEYGVPPRTEPELAWVQHVLAQLSPGGRAVLLLPPAAAARPAGRRVRAELLRRAAVRAVIGLPAGAAAPHHLGLHLWVLRRPRSGEHADQVLFAELTGEPDRDHDWPYWTAQLAAALTALDAGQPQAELSLAARTVRVIELLDDAVDLGPARRVHADPSTIDPYQASALRQRLADTLAQLPAALPGFGVVDRPAALPMISVGDLVRAGAITATARGQHRPDPDADSGTLSDAPAVPVWRARDLVAGRGPAGRLSADQVPSDAPRVTTGDVVSPVVAHQLIAKVVTDAEAGAVLGPNVQLLRPDPDLLDAWFLAGFLCHDGNAHRAASAGSIQRYDLRRAQIPRIPRSDQSRYGELFQRLAAFTALLEAAGADAEQLAKLLATGLAGGAFRPEPDR